MFNLKFFLICLLIIPKTCLGDNSIVVQSTTSTYNSGFYNYILPIIKSEINVVAHVVSVGTGAALKNAANCDGDVIIVHAKKRELDFVEKGFGVKRYNLMYNDFIIVGPKQNPAKLNIKDEPITVLEISQISVKSNFPAKINTKPKEANISGFSLRCSFL